MASREWLDECRAPNFVDFLSIREDDEADNFFDTNVDSDRANATAFFTPQKTPRPSRPKTDEEGAVGGRKILKAVRRSISANDDVVNTTAALETMLSLKSPFKAHGMITRQDVEKESRTIMLRSRKVSVKPSLKRALKLETEIVQHKIAKTMTLAESILHFQVNTPPRFRTMPLNFKPDFKTEGKRPVTIPQSPNLNTMALEHNKPSCSGNNKENEVFRQVKANPLNRKIFDSPKLARPEPKPATVAEPFKLTKIPEKPKQDDPEEKYVFKANPVPASCQAREELSKKPRRKWVLPSIKSEDSIEAVHNLIAATGNVDKKSTAVRPFSFDDRERKKRIEREKKLKQMRDAQTKFVPFQATPLPSFIGHSSDTSSVHSMSSQHSCTSITPTRVFKARQPHVLYQEPFVPQLARVPPVKPLDITLSTETRAQRRLELDLQRKIKEKEIEEARKENERMREEMERQEINILRKTLIHKPVPIPDYHSPS